MAGAAVGDLGVSLFVAGAVFGEIWVDSRSAKCCNFQYKMRLRSAKSSANGRVRDDQFMLGSWSDRPRTLNDTSTVVGQFLLDFGVQFCMAGAVFGVAPRIVNDVSYVTDINHMRVILRGRRSIW